MVVAIGSIALVVGGGSGSVAGSLITGKQIKNGTITSADIKNKSIQNADLAPSARARRGLPGAGGQQGVAGPQGVPGQTGPQGDRGVSAWEVIPSGRTVSGSIDVVASTSEGFHVEGPALMDSERFELPAKAPVDLSPAEVRFARGAFADPEWVDDRCNGTVEAPTAPRGLVCVYVRQAVSASNLRSYAGTLADRAFGIAWEVTPQSGVDLVVVSGSWAYTAP